MTIGKMIMQNIDQNTIEYIDPNKYIEFVKKCLVKIILERVRINIIENTKNDQTQSTKQLKEFDENYTNNISKLDIDKTISTFLLQDDLNILKQKFNKVTNKLNQNLKEKYEQIFIKDLNSYITILVKILYSHDHYVIWLNNKNINNNTENYMSVLSCDDFDDLLR